MADLTFVIYKMEVTAAHGKPIIVPLKSWQHDLPAMADAVTHKTRLIFICNPNNPTGTIVTAEAIDAFMARIPETFLSSLTKRISSMSTIGNFRIASNGSPASAMQSCCAPFRKYMAWPDCALDMDSRRLK